MKAEVALVRLSGVQAAKLLRDPGSEPAHRVEPRRIGEFVAEGEEQRAHLETARTLCVRAAARPDKALIAEALDALARAFDTGLDDRKAVEQDPLLDPLRGEERYREILAPR